HLYSSVCGSSVTLRGHGPQLGHVVTYLRFDAAYEDPLRVGDTIMENAVLDNLRRQTHTSGEWIAGQYAAVDEMPSLVCEFGTRGQSSLGWHYRWVGGSTRQQRQAFHSLRAYAFAREPPRLRVLAVAQSPPFVVMSYRRACKACQRQSPEDEQAQLKCECDGFYKLQTNALSNMTAASIPPTEGATNTSSGGHRPPGIISPRSEESVEDALATIHYFMSTFPATVLAPYLERLDSMLRMTVRPPLRDPILCQIQAHFGAPCERRLAPFSTTLEALGVVLGCSTDLTPFLHSFSAAHAASLLDKMHLEQSYESFVQHIYSNVARTLAAFNMTPQAFSDEILSLCAVLHAEYPEAATSCLEKCRAFNSRMAFEAFVAQMREVFMSMNAPPQAQPAACRRPLDGRWRYTAVSIMHLSRQLCPSILSLMRACYMGLTFEIVDNSMSFFMRSHHSLTNKAWAEFHVDGLPHVHRVFPNGESTMAIVDGLVHGDYVAAAVNDTAVTLTLFSWPASSISRYCYAIHLQIGRVEGPTGRLAVCVQVTAAREVSPVEDYWCMTVDERVALFDRGNAHPVATFRLEYENQRTVELPK
ncbi:hypothetical protein AeRB84_006598, partial [Aphanomyces euteiches]